MRSPARHVCPICGRDAPPRRGEEERPPNESFPFCSRACKLVDLGRWLDGDYRILDPGMDAHDGDGGPGERE